MHDDISQALASAGDNRANAIPDIKREMLDGDATVCCVCQDPLDPRHDQHPEVHRSAFHQQKVCCDIAAKFNLISMMDGVCKNPRCIYGMQKDGVSLYCSAVCMRRSD